MTGETEEVFYHGPLPEEGTAYDSRDVHILALRLTMTRGIGPRTVLKVLADITAFLPSEIDRFPDDLLEQKYGMRRDSVQEFRSRSAEAADAFDALASEDVAVLVAGSSDYPIQLATALAAGAPPVLFARGDLGLLDWPGVGFCGSRAASDAALRAVDDCAGSLAKSGVNVLSGYAHGVDMSAHHAALEARGVTTVVLAEGVRRYRKKQELAAFPDDAILVLSQFPPDYSWSVGNAMTRNWTICALADAMVVVESRLEGGTFAAGKAALELKRPLYVVDYGPTSAPGNTYFLDRGAKPLRRRRDGGPAMERLISDARAQASRDDRARRRLKTDPLRTVSEAPASTAQRPPPPPRLFR